MYKPTDYEHQQISFFHFNSSCGIALDKENEWIKNADRLPWKAWETLYAAMFPGKGRMARSCRMVIGSLIIQMRMGFTDRDLVILCFNSFERTSYKLQYNESLIEACFDSGVIYNQDKTVSEVICELELELEKGSDSDLTGLSNLIKAGFGCIPLDKSKFQRTLELAKRG